MFYITHDCKFKKNQQEIGKKSEIHLKSFRDKSYILTSFFLTFKSHINVSIFDACHLW